MDIETDLLRISHLAEQKEDENYEFRAFLKRSRMSDRKLDALVQRHFAEVAAQIDCKECANCCKVLDTLFSKEELARIAEHLGVSAEELVERHGLQWDKQESAWKSGKPCPFLEGNLCSVYEVCPQLCRDYPYLERPEFRHRLFGAVDNCSVCPISYNVFERLKRELWHRRR